VEDEGMGGGMNVGHGRAPGADFIDYKYHQNYEVLIRRFV
jgi:hypothetical protein